MSHDPRYLKAIDHFNRGEYFEAHEVWEDYWVETMDEKKGFLHGLVQAAVTLHHAGRGNAGGARSLYARMRNNLDNYRPSYMGLDVERFLARMERVMEPVLADPPAPIDPKLIPTIALTEE